MASKLNQFAPELQQRIQARIAAGTYQNEDEVLHEAMDALEEREQEKLRRWNDRNQLASEQSQAGLSKPLDLPQVLENIEQRFAAQNRGQ